MNFTHRHRMNIGGVSIIFIFVIFALTILAVLSIRTSYHELKMSEKTRASIEEYYIADSEAEELLATIDATLNNTKGNKLGGNPKLEQELQEINGITQVDLPSGNIKYEVPVNNAASLQVELHIDSTSGTPDYTIQAWRLNPLPQTGYDDENMKLWDGTINE